MGKKKVKFDEKKPGMKVLKYYHEKIFKNSDMDYKTCSNDRAKHILGLMFKLPSHQQTGVLNDMEQVSMIEREGQQIIKALPV